MKSELEQKISQTLDISLREFPQGKIEELRKFTLYFLKKSQVKDYQKGLTHPYFQEIAKKEEIASQFQIKIQYLAKSYIESERKTSDIIRQLHLQVQYLLSVLGDESAQLGIHHPRYKEIVQKDLKIMEKVRCDIQENSGNLELSCFYVFALGETSCYLGKTHPIFDRS